MADIVVHGCTGSEEDSGVVCPLRSIDGGAVVV